MKLLLTYITAIIIFSSSCYSQTAGTAGAFARMGFGARGMSMGNTLTAVTNDEISAYYNPALSAFSEDRTAMATFSILSLDRYLNFLSYTQAVKPTAGLSVGLINAGVRKIDGRNSDGMHTEDYSTYENQFFLSFSNRIDNRISLGVGIKLYHSKLFEEVTSTTVGFDVGICFQLTDDISIGAAFQDLGSKYIWDSKPIYPDPYGKTTTDKFPSLRRMAIAYMLPNGIGTITAEFENSSAKSNVMRIGAEYYIMDYFIVRSGIDRLDFSEHKTGAKPSLGFTVKKPHDTWTPSVTYGFIFESFAPHGMHIITISGTF
ncbi:MAG: hypothetical protein QME52_06320 [Bacteroidota bacterium]|nr:hypothetical protein [Bacteroidota bacterium]